MKKIDIIKIVERFFGFLLKQPYVRGFTIIEMIVVIAIIGVLSSIVAVNVTNTIRKGRDARRIADVKQLQTALISYYEKTGHYPQFTALDPRCNTTASNSLGDLVTEKVLSSVPIDPTNTSSPSPRLCYEYIGIGTALNYSAVSSWYCDGRPRTDYQYSFLFSTESITLTYSRLANSAGTPNNEYTYCIHGPLR